MARAKSSSCNDLRDRFKRSALSHRVRTSLAYVRAKVFLKRVAGKELWLRPEIRPALFKHEDWALCSAPLLGKKSRIYSFGVGRSIEFERALTEAFHTEVHAFDPTPSVASWMRDQEAPADFHFHPWALAGRDETLTLYPRVRGDGATSGDMYTLVPEAASVSDGIAVEAKRLSTVIKDLGHDAIDVLKMDVEGAEYEALSDLLESEIYPTQILVEFHHRFATIGKERTREMVRRLRRVGYRVAFVSAFGREVTLVQPDRLVATEAASGIQKARN